MVTIFEIQKYRLEILIFKCKYWYILCSKYWCWLWLFVSDCSTLVPEKDTCPRSWLWYS